jgi:predicted ATPase
MMQMRQGLAAFQAAGAFVATPIYFALLAAGSGKIGQIEEGLELLAEGFRAIDKTGERQAEAELHRLKGELTLQAGAQSSVRKAQNEAEKCFRRALDIARHQQARTWELRAATSLSRLWHGQGRRSEARNLLAQIYGWFTEGLDTADLKRAKALLEELET